MRQLPVSLRSVSDWVYVCPICRKPIMTWIESRWMEHAGYRERYGRRVFCLDCKEYVMALQALAE